MIADSRTRAPEGVSTSFRLQRPGMALALLGCFFIFFLIVSGVILPFIPKIVNKPEAAIKISVVIQDLLIFICPAIGTAMIVTRLPARLLCVDRFPDLRPILLSIATLISAIPAMNAVIHWNENWQLPASMAGPEQYFRQLEEAARATTSILMNGASITSLIVSVLIVGVLAGFSEELLFRGAFQRILGQTGMNMHVVIWLVAFIFSAFHFQLFGLVPRILLGAFFGYLLWWSKSLWLPIILHVCNNSIVVISEYISNNRSGQATEAPSATSIDTFGADMTSGIEVTGVIISIILTAAGIYMLRRFFATQTR